MLLSIAHVRFTWFNKCKRFAGLNFKCKLGVGLIVKNCQLFSGRGTVSVELIKWDTADFIVKYLDKRIDTTTQANELTNASPINRIRIISLVNGLIKKEIDSFRDQIKNQEFDRPIREEKKIKGNWTINRSIKFSQPLISSDNNTLIIKEWTSGNDCWETTISVYQRIDNKWKRDFDIKKYGICS